MSSANVLVLVAHRLQPDRLDQGRREIAGLVATVVQEETDCLGIDVTQNLEDPSKIVLIERWSSREAYEGPHMQTAHIRSFMSRAMAFLAGPPDISFWNESPDK